MLEGPSYLVSRDLPSSCEQESKWIYNTSQLIEHSKGKHRLEDGEELALRKSCKVSDAHGGERTMKDVPNLFLVQTEQSDDQHQTSDQSDSSSLIHQLGLSDAHGGERTMKDVPNLFLVQTEQSDDQHQTSDQSDSSSLIHQLGLSDAHGGERTMKDVPNLFLVQTEQSDDQHQTSDQSDSSSLIHQLGRDMSINCLVRCSRSDYGSIGSLNQSFRSLIQGGELYRLRRQMGIVEHWIYFSCSLLEWEAFDPNRRAWKRLPRMPSNDCFMWSDKESLAVGTELLVFGKEITAQVIYRYSILMDTWSPGTKMNTPRCLFGSASLGEIAIIAGGCDPRGIILSSAELYNSDTGTWVTLPCMNKARKMCSGVFMDGNFYVIGGIGVGNSKSLTCGEVYDLKAKTWHVIPNMFPGRNAGAGVTEAPAAAEAPPLVAVVNNVLYAADYAQKEVRRYDKERNLWVTIGSLPERAVSMNGWGLAFRACGDRLVVIGGPRALGEGLIELNSWVPDEDPPHWDLLARKPSASFVYNCAVMGC